MARDRQLEKMRYLLKQIESADEAIWRSTRISITNIQPEPGSERELLMFEVRRQLSTAVMSIRSAKKTLTKGIDGTWKI